MPANLVVVGIAGTAKNTGKTTVLQALLNGLMSCAVPVALTSIGYDGEAIDNVTGLPKPRVTVAAGSTVITASGCVDGGSALLQVTESTPIVTPLGNVVLAKACTAGTVVLAGPPTGKGLRSVAALVEHREQSMLFVDGALNRIAPLAVADAVVLATGAARNRDLEQLGEETGAISNLFAAVPQVGEVANLGGSGTVAFRGAERLGEIGPGSLLSREAGRTLLDHAPADADSFYVPGQVSFEALDEVARRADGRSWSLCLTDQIKLLLVGLPADTMDLVTRLQSAGVNVCVGRSIPLLAITVNPFYPNWRMREGQYEPAFVDADELHGLISTRTRHAVIDVMREGAEALIEDILCLLGR